jgi:hypothetical protein
MSVNVSSDMSLTIKGISPASGPGLVLLANPSLITSNVTQGDYFADTFTINPSTPATLLDLLGIVSSTSLWIQTDAPIAVTLTQNAIDRTFIVDSFVTMNTAFTAIKLANSSATVAAHINVVIVGNRVTNPNTPGIY